ncbi:MAG: lipoprotein [Oligoflexia bacterium]|nr:MAG: lipoprotein [Oligoflexia bacterium]
MQKIAIFFIGFLLTSAFLTGCGTFGSEDKEAAEMHLRIGTAQLQEGAYPQALASLLKAEELDGDNPVIENNLALAYFVRDRFELAEKHVARALTLKPDYSDARNNYGRILIERGRPQDAITELKKVIADLTYQFPEKPLINTGIAYFKLKQYDQARIHFQKALDIQRDNCLAHSYYGRSLYEQKKLDRATEALDRAVGFCQRGQFDEPHFFSAMAYLEAGDKVQAEARFEDIIKLYPRGKYTEKARSILKTMRK